MIKKIIATAIGCAAANLLIDKVVRPKIESALDVRDDGLHTDPFDNHDLCDSCGTCKREEPCEKDEQDYRSVVKGDDRTHIIVDITGMSPHEAYECLANEGFI